MRDETPKQRQPDDDARQPAPPEESLIQLWEVASGKEIRRIGMGKTRINQAVLAPDGKTVATAHRQDDPALGPGHGPGNPPIRGSRRRARPHRLLARRHEAGVHGSEVDFPTAGESPPLTAPIHVWDTATGRELRHWETDNASRTCFSPDGTTLATAGTQVIRLWDVASGREIRPQTGHRSAIEDAAFTPDGRSIVTLGHDRTIRFWDPATGKQIRQFDASDAGLRFAALSADGKTLATGGGFQPTRLWDVASGRELRRFQMPGKISDHVRLLRGPLARWPDAGHLGERRRDFLGHGDG